MIKNKFESIIDSIWSLYILLFNYVLYYQKLKNSIIFFKEKNIFFIKICP